MVIAIANQKGGVAKTTTAHNLGVALSLLDKKVLMIDLDSQASLTISTGVEPNDTADNSIVSVLADGKERIKDCIHKTRNENLYIIPSVIDLAGLEMQLFARTSREKILARAIEPIRNDFDFIIIDCPPQLGILTVNALSCADGIIIPVKTDYLAYRGIKDLEYSISDVQEYLNPNAKIFGVIATIYEKVSKDDRSVLAMLNQEYNVIGVVSKKVMVKKGVYDGIAVVELAPSSDIAQSYKDVAKMIVSGEYRKTVSA
ncbi:MAG: AAA family ATPase [Oscillospiraceae bacterium]|nr:AAA family ATPase [Oscillospiraceae bacterium]